MWRSPHFPPVKMEDRFNTAYHDGPAVHLGSRTMPLFKASAYEQAYEAIHLAYTKPGDTIVLRNADPVYLKYWRKLVPHVHIYNLFDPRPKRYLSQMVLQAPGTLPWLQANIPSDAQLFVFFSTADEQVIAQKLGIPLYGSPEISSRFGTKSGVEALARIAQVEMPDRQTCTTKNALRATMLDMLNNKRYSQIIVKNDESIGGGWSKRIRRREVAQGLSEPLFAAILKKIRFIEGTPVVVEQWREDTQASASVHIEIPPGRRDPVIRWGWQQLIARDGVSYQGAAPLMLPKAAIDHFIGQTQMLAKALGDAGAVGSYAPNFLITRQNQAVLVELNARIPLSAFALAIVQQVKGAIGDGFITHYVNVPGKWPFAQVKHVLKNAGILIERPNGAATWGVVPFNVGLLPHGKCSLVAIAPTWPDARQVMTYAVKLLSQG